MLKIKEQQMYMDIAFRIAQESHAIKAKVGCVLVKDNNILSMGFNGTPSGFDNCCEFDGENGLKTKPEVIHAESNAIVKCAREGIPTKDSTMYCTLEPCVQCSKLIIQSGIKEVIYFKEWDKGAGPNLLKKAGIKCKQINY